MFNGKNLSDWLNNNVVIVVVVVVGIGVLIKAGSGETRKAVTTVAILMLGLLVIGMAPHAREIGNWAYGLVA
jgi:hypothetical protein